MIWSVVLFFIAIVVVFVGLFLFDGAGFVGAIVLVLMLFSKTALSEQHKKELKKYTDIPNIEEIVLDYEISLKEDELNKMRKGLEKDGK
jgi:hypothetical protein